MYSVSMTTRLGFAAVLGAIAVVVIASGKDRASITTQCKTENCAVSTTNIGQVTSKKVPKSTQQSSRSGDGKAIPGLRQETLRRKWAAKAVMTNRTVLIKRSEDKPVGKKPAQRAVKSSSGQFAEKQPKRLVNPPQQFVESPQYRRTRREDDPSSWQVDFN